MKFEPVQHEPSCAPFFQDVVEANIWEPQCSHPCAFDPPSFLDKMMNLVLNPNLNSTWLFRADVLYDSECRESLHIKTKEDGSGVTGGAGSDEHVDAEPPSVIPHDIKGMKRYRTLVRRLIPRNEKRDRPLDQTCSFYQSLPPPKPESSDEHSTLVIYSPHASHQDVPFYHPKVRGIAHLHRWNPSAETGTISIHYLPFGDCGQSTAEDTVKLERIAYHLLETIHKHGHALDYVKRVHHDVVVPRRRFQDRYAALKRKYARGLVETWAEKTDPTKHVFEDLGIAAFLIELWADMYPTSNTKTKPEPKPDSNVPGTCDQRKGFPGFVDMACGNGLLVHILKQEGYPGWGFDVRRRKSWAQYSAGPPSPLPSLPSPSSNSPQNPQPSSSPSPSEPLQERLLLPSLILSSFSQDQQQQILSATNPDRPLALHGGTFPPGTFIISNHGDELTPWTPILASLSRCPFIVIPCCSHNFAGERFRAPPPRDKSKPKSAYASLVDWVAHVAEDCGWEVETEMLRIPSTRNTCMLGRRRRLKSTGDNNGAADEGGGMDEASAWAVIEKYGGVKGYFDAVSKLVKSEARGH